jgi:hypothetical protein
MYFDAEGKQLRALPAKWIHLSGRFKPGDKIRFLKTRNVFVGKGKASQPINQAEWRDMKGEIGVVVKVNDGHRVWPNQWYHAESECWMTDSAGWLTVRFPFDLYGLEDDGVTPKPRACRAEDESREWEFVK